MTTKTLLTTLAATGILLAAASINTRAQGWETILDLDSGRQYLNATIGCSRAIMIDPIPAPATPASDWPNLLVTGDRLVDGSDAQIFRLSQAGDPTLGSLTALDGMSSAASAAVFAMTSDQAGNLFWAGGENYAWKVRRSSDAGASWEEVRNVQNPSGSTARARGATVDNNGNLYVCGMRQDAAGLAHWLVEKSTDQGGTWTIKDVFQGAGACDILNSKNVVEAMDILHVPNGSGGALFAVGTRGTVSGGSWMVTRSRDGGGTWQIVDSNAWLPKGTKSSRARKVANDSLGRIFVLGDTAGGLENGYAPWVVRMSEDGGNTWRIIFGPWNYGPIPYPLALTVDVSGSVWAVGVTHKQYGTRTVTYTSQATWVRLLETAPGTWSSSYGFLTSEAQGVNRASADAITTDCLGRIYVSGTCRATSTDPIKWFVQRWRP